MENDFIREIKVELPDNRHEYTDVFIGTINPITASQLLEKLAVDLPLPQFHLNHLKRIRRIVNERNKIDDLSGDSIGNIDTPDVENKHSNIILEVIICPVTYVDYVDMTLYNEKFISIRSTRVPKFEPNTYDEYMHANSVWPTSFKRNHKSFQGSLDEILSSEFIIKNNMKLALDDINRCKIDFKWESDKCGSIIVNPINNMVVTSCYDVISYNILKFGDKYRNHPLLSPTLMCIDGVSLICRDELVNNASLCDDHYLCTGLDLYVVNEPDIMSGMALVHSRIRSVYYLHSDTKYGALDSIYKIHSMNTLNHKYKVYQINIETLKVETITQDTVLSAAVIEADKLNHSNNDFTIGPTTND